MEDYSIFYIGSYDSTYYVQFLTNQSSSTKQTIIVKYKQVIFQQVVYHLTQVFFNKSLLVQPKFFQQDTLDST